jgi:hypothetical protein
MKITQILVILIGILTVLLVCLALGETMNPDWNTVATQAAPAVVGLAFFAIVIAAIVSRR